MHKKRLMIILSILVIFIFAASVYSADKDLNTDQMMDYLDETDSSLLEGCCSIVCQLDGNNSIIAFRRDANYSADINIEQINWHGKDAIKQYKTEGGYFSQVIVTSDGWVIGFGGLDDGEDSQRIENMTADMVLNGTISNSTLEQIKDIKSSYNRGHVIIKAPNGTYGAVVNSTFFTGHLKPGEYISVPNKYSYVRFGDIQLNATDKIKLMNQLEITDAYGLVRRDITVFYFYSVDNDTFKGNITDIYISNDDGSTFDMNTGGMYDDVKFLNNTTFLGKDLPIAPNYTYMGSVNFTDEGAGWNVFGDAFNTVMHIIAFILFIVVIFLLIRLINQIRYARRRR